MEKNSLTLWTIEESLTTLMAASEEVAADPELTGEQRDEELAIIRTTLADYVRKEVEKVDNIRGYLLHCKLMANAAREERAAMEARVRLWEARESRLKEICIGALDASDKKRVEGRTGTLTIRGNGGVQPLVIDNPAIIPDEQCVYVGQVSAKLYRQISMAALTDPATKLERQPSNALIREALATEGGVPGAHLESRGRSLVVK